MNKIRRPRISRRIVNGLVAMVGHIEAFGDEHELVDPAAGASDEDRAEIESAIRYVDQLFIWYNNRH